MSSQKIVFYDGDCGFCNRSVNFILKNDKTKTIQFAMLQSDYTKETFIKNGWESADLSTFYFYENEILYERSTAALRLTKYFKYPQRFLVVFYGVPVLWNSKKKKEQPQA